MRLAKWVVAKKGQSSMRTTPRRTHYNKKWKIKIDNTIKKTTKSYKGSKEDEL
jgi:hypothetical protein